MGAKRLVKSISFQSIQCEKRYQRTASQLMGQLPKDRADTSSAFPSKTVDRDFAGQFFMRQGHVRKPTRIKTYSSDQKKFRFSSRITAVLRCTVSIKTVKKRPRAIRTTLIVRAFYGRTIFAINCANCCDVSATDDPYFRFFLRTVKITTRDGLSEQVARKLLEYFVQNHRRICSKITEKLPPKSPNWFQNRRTGFKIAEELAPK